MKSIHKILLVCVGLLSPFADLYAQDSVVIASWDFGAETSSLYETQGAVLRDQAGPRPPLFPDFESNNTALGFRDDGGYLSINDPVEQSHFDFTNGDAITLEAWVKLDLPVHNSPIYIIGKGRTGNPHFAKDNQNWALRLQKIGDTIRVGFLFATQRGSGDTHWHRWTSRGSFPIQSEWHHVAAAYRFGEPESMRGWIDGQPTTGSWDMGGKTSAPPVVDDDQVWIGSANKANRFVGLLDNVVVHRGLLSDSTMASRFRRVGEVPKPQLVKEVMPDIGPIDDGTVLVTLGEGLPAADRWLMDGEAWPNESIRWKNDAFFIQRLPVRYDDWGIRDAWKDPVLLRMAADVEFPTGSHRLLMRARGMSRLWIDGELVARTDPVIHKSPDGEQPITPLAVPPLPDVRPHGYRQQEVFADVSISAKQPDAGNRCRVVWEVIVGGKNQRTEPGEACVAVQMEGRPSYDVITPAGADPLALTNLAIEGFLAQMEAMLISLDDQSRRQAASSQDEFWQRRHRLAAEWATVNPPPPIPDVTDGFSSHPVDAFIGSRIQQAVTAAAESDSSTTAQFYGQVLPLLREQCFRCHGEKSKGGLKLNSRKAALLAGDSEQPAVVPGDPDGSEVMSQIRNGAMPPTGTGLREDQIEIIEQWIRNGASWPAPQIIVDNAEGGDIAGTPRLPGSSISQTPESDGTNAAVTPNSNAGVIRIMIPSIVNDEAFMRRVYLDTVGVPPTLEEARRFLDDPQPGKRDHLVDRLLDDPRLADHWISLWQDLLAENPTLLNQSMGSTGPFRWFLHESLRDNKPLDRMVTELIMMRGSADTGGSAGFSLSGESDAPYAEKAHIIAGAFMGVELQCARCHDSPYHSTTQRDLYALAAMLERKTVKVPSTSRVPDAFFEKKGRESLIRVTLKPDEPVAAEWPSGDALHVEDIQDLDSLMLNPDDTRERLATLITAPHNQRFAQVTVNRIWKQLMGAGFVQTVNDWEGKSPSHPQLLKWLAHELITNGYDLRFVMRQIMTSQTYQREAVGQNATADPDQRFFAAPDRRRLTAEQIVDSLHAATGNEMNVEELTFVHDGQRPIGKRQSLGVPRRAWMFASLNNERDRPSLSLPRARVVADVLQAFGWSGSRQKPISARDVDPDVLQPGVLSNGALAMALTRASLNSELSRRAIDAITPNDLVDEWFLRILCRQPTANEMETFANALREGFDTRLVPTQQIVYPPKLPQLPQVTWFNHLQSETNTIQQELERRVTLGPPPDPRLDPNWRAVYEDFVWSLINHHEFVWVP